MDRNQLLQLIDKYFSNQCTPEEIQLLDDWYRGYDHAENYLDQLSEVNREGLRDKVLQQIHKRLDQETGERMLSTPLLALAPRYGRAWKVAVAVLLLVFGASLGYYFLTPSSTKKYETAYGEKNVITLPDGSRVVLNGHSTLRSNSNWSTASAREVWLEGEAFFSVTHMKNNQRFVVHTADGLLIEVLGTSFNVKKRGNNTQVVLREGKIRLQLPQGGRADTLTMKPGDLIEISGQSNVLTREVVQPEKYSAWQNPNLTFVNTPLRDILKMIQEVYGDETVVTDPSLIEMRVTGTVPNDNLDILLKALEETLDCHIEQHDNRITLSKPKTN